ncbi:RAD50-interacting protein 1 isoform X2 [Hoplias malabaricus]|uniref:RAD50-interacting protein 1 isoform X2 n=1 Tax=Hoplias malabaricus TaxID=27720 RepID=UPI0034619F09
MAASTVETRENNNNNRRMKEIDALISDSDPESSSTSEDVNYMEHVAELVQREFGADVKSLKKVNDLMGKLREENTSLEKQVLTVSSSVPLRVSAALSAAEESRTRLDALLQKERLLSNTLQQHLQSAQIWADNLLKTLGQLDIVERHMKYLQCLARIEELSDSIQQFLMTNSVWEAIGAVGSMATLDMGLQESGCTHLQTFLRETLHFWHKILKDKLASDFEDVLAQLHWPIVSPPVQSLSPPANAQELNSQLELLVSQLLSLQTSDDLISEKKEVVILPGLLHSTPLSLPIQIMLLPLSKRFKYHFTGNRQTNSLNKPEWYLTQVLVWMGHNSNFMEEKIQSILDRAGGNVNAKVGKVKSVAVEKVDAMLSAEGAWSSQYKDITDMDELKAPDCAETFMTLLLVITDRYRSLPCPKAQLSFLALQRELVDDFRIRLTQVMKEESRQPLGARYCAVLNAANYISTVLSDWGDNVFFLQLQQAAVSEGEEVLGPLGATESGRLASLEGSLFEELLALLERLRGDMIGRLLDAVMKDVKEKAQPYCRDRWISLPSQCDQATMSLSSAACPMLLCLRDQLLQLQQLLCLPLFQMFWQGLAERLDLFLYQDVILYNHFNEGGAAQLQFDMTRNLFPLFGHYCKRPENFFKHVKESCIILNLKVGPALLLCDVLNQAEKGLEEGEASLRPQEPTPESALNELGVYKLAPKDVQILLNCRSAWLNH